eukprot:868400-Pelagomonas_calceolata.AAC.5
MRPQVCTGWHQTSGSREAVLLEEPLIVEPRAWAVKREETRAGRLYRWRSLDHGATGAQCEGGGVWKTKSEKRLGKETRAKGYAPSRGASDHGAVDAQCKGKAFDKGLEKEARERDDKGRQAVLLGILLIVWEKLALAYPSMSRASLYTLWIFISCSRVLAFSQLFCNLWHNYTLQPVPPPRLSVQFKEQFLIANPTRAYEELLQCVSSDRSHTISLGLPHVQAVPISFVGNLGRLRAAVQILGSEIVVWEHWGSVLVEGSIGADVGVEGRTSTNSPLLQAAAPNLAQGCGQIQCVYQNLDGFNEWPS